jgi:hypothetical protein
MIPGRWSNLKGFRAAARAVLPAGLKGPPVRPNTINERKAAAERR